MTEKIEPALTPEGWERFGADRPGGFVEKFRDLFVGRPTRNMAFKVKGETVQVIELEEAHAIAAIALYGQPFGFTREMAQALRDMHEAAPEGVATTRQWEAIKGDLLLAVADRIEALLPPE